MYTLEIRTNAREELIDITRGVAAFADSAGVAEGVAYVTCPHTTAALTLNEHADPDVAADLITALAALVPRRGAYRHVEGNSDAHIKASLIGSSVVVPVSGGRLALGRWQGIFFCEFDGPRHRQVHVTIVET